MHLKFLEILLRRVNDLKRDVADVVDHPSAESVISLIAQAASALQQIRTDLHAKETAKP